MRPKPRTLPRRGQHLAEVSEGRLISYQEDVLDMKRRIEGEFEGAIGVFFDTDPSAECWVITQVERDGTVSLLFTTKTLSQGTLDRIKRCDQTRNPHYDPLKELEQEEAVLEREKDRRFEEKIGEAGERLFFALRKDHQIHTPKVFMSNSGKRVRDIS
jgi:hypothetical protein